jgi:murein DD-endopeptidase MepM/ murein hydrolase activator NlpD
MGVDLQRSRKGGEQVLASRGGRISFAKVMSGYGRIVSILHKDGYVTRYAHLKTFLVKTGERVDAGDPVGIVGKTGRASTPHLHFEVLTPEGKFIDPMYFLDQ